MKQYRILSLDAKTIYDSEIKNGNEVGYSLPEKKDEEYYKKFNIIFECRSTACLKPHMNSMHLWSLL